MRLRLVSAMLGVGFAAFVSPAAAAARPAVHVLLRTPAPVVKMVLDRSGRAVWAQEGKFPGGGCFLHRGALLRQENRLLEAAPCAPAYRGGSDDLAGLVASASASTSRLRIAWAEVEVSHHAFDWTVWAYVGGGGGRVKLASLSDSCGMDGCFSAGPAGSDLGPMASKDGIVLYAVNDVTALPPCDGCYPRVTGGRIRQVHYSAGGAYTTIVPSAPAANQLVTAGARLAEQPYTATGDAAAEIEIRDVATGTLRTTVPVNGTITAMAMSHKVLAVLTTNAAGNHLVRYSAANGTPLGSTPVGALPQESALSICGKRILYHTLGGMFIFRLDLNRSHRVPVRRNSGGMLDNNGIRWVATNWAADTWSSIVHGIEFP